MGLFRGYAKFKIGQKIFQMVRNALRNINFYSAEIVHRPIIIIIVQDLVISSQE